MRILHRVLLLVLVLQTPFLIASDTFSSDKTKRIVKTFELNENTYVEIDNKYGDIEVEIWDKDSIKFEIEIIAHSDDEEELDEMLDVIEIDLKASSSFIVVQTNWSNDIGIFKKGFLKINQEVSNNVRYKVNYHIKLPAGIDLDITNSFGNIFLSDYIGKLEVDLAYGDLRAHNISNLKQLKVKSGKVKVKELSKGRVILNSVKPFDIEKASELTIESSSSDIRIEEIEKLSIKSNHDDISIDNVKELSGNLSMSDLIIEELGEKINTISKYGTITIKNISSLKDNTYLEGTKTDFKLKFNPRIAMNLDISITEKENLTNDSFIVIKSTEKESSELWRIKGYVYQKGETELKIKCINGYVQLNAE